MPHLIFHVLEVFALVDLEASEGVAEIVQPDLADLGRFHRWQESFLVKEVRMGSPERPNARGPPSGFPLSQPLAPDESATHPQPEVPGPWLPFWLNP